MTKLKKYTLVNKGCVGRRIKIKPFKSDTIGQEELIQKGEVILVGPDSRCKIGDIVVFNNDGLDKVRLNDVDYYYVLDTDQFIYEVNP